MAWWTTAPGGTPVNSPDGYNETQGAMADAAWDGATSSVTIMSVLKRIAALALGWSKFSLTALTTTATVSAAAGRFGGGMFLNLNAAPAYIQCFDTTAAVVLGTTAPDFVIPIPANGTPANGAAFVLALEAGIALVNGLKVAATTTPTGAAVVATGLTGFVMYR